MLTGVETEPCWRTSIVFQECNPSVVQTAPTWGQSGTLFESLTWKSKRIVDQIATLQSIHRMYEAR